MRYPTAYRSEPARAERAHSRAQPVAVGFVAPGFPVEVPLSGGAAGGGGGAAIATASGAAPSSAALWGGLGVGASVGVGLGLGAVVKADIDRFKRTAKQPFYDAARWGEFYSDIATYDPDVTYDPVEDLDLRRWIDEQVRRYYERRDELQTEWYGAAFVPPPNFYSPDGRHAPVITRDGVTTWWQYVNSCPSNAAPTRWMTSAAGNLCSGQAWSTGNVGVDNGGNAATCGNFASSSLANNGGGWSQGLFVCPTSVNISLRTSGYSVLSSTTVRIKEAWLRKQTMPTGYTLPKNLALDAPVVGTQYMPGFGADHPPVSVKEGLEWSRPRRRRRLRRPRTRPLREVQPGTRPVPRPAVPPAVMPFPNLPIVEVIPGTVPVTVPDQTITTAPDTEPKLGLPSPPFEPWPRRDPPSHSTKVNVRTAAPFAWAALNFSTEVQDTLEAANNALPKHLRAKPRKRGAKPAPHDILQAIWDNFDQWSGDRFVENFINMQVEDMYYGLQGQAAQSAYRGAAGFSSTGITASNRGSRYAEAAGFDADQSIFIPQVSYDDGEWTVSLGERSLSFDSDPHLFDSAVQYPRKGNR